MKRYGASSGGGSTGGGSTGSLISSITGAVQDVGGAVLGVLEVTNPNSPPVTVVPAPDYRPEILLGFGLLVALIMWKG